jgi:outer membrane protein assembly factor BamB
VSPEGQLVWDNPGDPIMYEYGQIGAEVVFGPSRAHGPMDRLYVAFDRQLGWYRWAFDLHGGQQWAVPTGPQADPFAQLQTQLAVGPDGTVYMTSLLPRTGWGLEAIDPGTGSSRWAFYEFPGNGMSAPDVGRDGVIYVARNLGTLHAFNPDGSERWRFFDGSIVDYPIASPANQLIFAGGRPDFGMPGFVRAYSPHGEPLWSIELGAEHGGNQILFSRPRFTPDGQSVYFGTTILGGEETDPYSYLYAVDTAGVTDTVTIQRAWYAHSRGLLSVQATDPDAGAILSVYVTATDELIGTLMNRGGGRYSGHFRWPQNPHSITVRSSLGGSATRSVSVRRF